MEVIELWRYPVKSLRGEALDYADIRGGGFVDDRLVHVWSPERERVVTSRTHPQLLGLRGGIGDDGEPTIDGISWLRDEARERVRSVAGDVELRRGSPRGPDRFDVLPLTVATDGAVAALGVDRRRLRPNIVIGGVDGLAEQLWAGLTLTVGPVQISVRKRRARCVMTTFDPDTLEQDHGVLRDIVERFDGMIALDCEALEPGVIRVGDAVAVSAVRAA